MNIPALSFYLMPSFEQFTTFLVNIRTSRSCLLYMYTYLLYLLYYFTLSGAILKMILTTEEMTTATLKVVSAATKVILATEEVIATT